MFLTSPYIDQALAQACAVCSPVSRGFERNRDLYEAADAADATACSRVRQLVRD
jgi:hypothetical protein